MFKAETPIAKYYRFEDALKDSGFLLYTCVGNSMLPFLRQRRDIVEIRPLNGKPKKYDVVLYKRRNQYILHRISRVLPDGKYIIAGDHNTFQEYDVTDEMILGVMTRAIRDGKSIYPTSLLYCIYYHLWVDFFPIKVFILKAKGKIRNVGGRIKRKVTG